MKYIAGLMTTLFCLGLASCTPDKASTGAAAADAPRDVNEIIRENIDYTPPLKDRNDDYAPALPVPQNEYTSALTRDYWVFEFYVIKDVIDVRFQNIGRWFQFNPDGTFRTGRWNEEIGVGSWKFEYRADKPYLIVDSNIKGMDEIFQIQALSGANDAFALTGHTKDAEAIHIKMIHLLSIPTKEQFGY